jgi:hypothetical protein
MSPASNQILNSQLLKERLSALLITHAPSHYLQRLIDTPLTAPVTPPHCPSQVCKSTPMRGKPPRAATGHELKDHRT